MKALTSLMGMTTLVASGLLASCDDVVDRESGSGETGASESSTLTVEVEFTQANQGSSTEYEEYPVETGEIMELPWIDRSDPTVVLIEEVTDGEVTIVVQTPVYTGYYSLEEGATYTLADGETAEFFRNEDDVAVYYSITFESED